MTLALVIIWAGYTAGIWGFSKIKAAYNPSLALTLSDVALPSHRAHYISIASQWVGLVGTSSSSSNIPPGSSVVGGTPGQQAGGTPPGTTVIQPSGGATALKGVDLQGNHYQRDCPTCPWRLVAGPTGLPIVNA